MEPLPEFLPLLSRRSREPDPGPAALADFRVAMNRALVKWAAPGPALGRVRDLAVDGPHRPIPVRVYEPAGPGVPVRPGPVILFCHGSGFVLGNLDTHDWLARSLSAAVGAVVVSVDYLLAPEHPFPAALDECVAVLGWVAAGGAGPAADPSQIVVAGDSAGGALVAGVSRTARDRGGSRVCAQLLMYPVCGHELDTPSWHRYGGGGYFLDAPTMRWFWSQYLHDPGEASNPYAVPLAAREFRGLPPAVLLVAGCDPLADEGREYAARLRAGGTQVRVVEYAGAIHGFMTMSAISPSAAAAVQQVAAELRELTGRQVTA
jgi:acetyl esterase